jgi:hypothetical protein
LPYQLPPPTIRRLVLSDCSSMAQSIISLVLVAVLPINAVAVALTPCCCTAAWSCERPACCVVKDSVFPCCKVREQAAKCPRCRCPKARANRGDCSPRCCCVQRVQPLATSPAPREILRPQDHLLCSLGDEPRFLPCHFSGSHRAELLSNQFWAAHPPFMVLFCSWLN